MTYKPASAALNEVLLQAAIRAERLNAEAAHEKRASDLAKRNDRLSVSNRVPAASQTETNAHGSAPAGT